MGSEWIGVDLDGTLAEYDEWRGVDHIGPPIPAMVERVRRWLAEGRRVKIVTARVSHPNDAAGAAAAIFKWCLEHLGAVLPVTCMKDYQMLELWDDRAVQVEPNTGRVLGRSTRGLD